MATYAETKVKEGLLAHLGTIPLSPRPPISAPGLGFTKPDGPWLEASFLPGPSDQVDLGPDAQKRISGIFSVVTATPEGEDIVTASELAGAVIAHFSRELIVREGIEIEVREPPYEGTHYRADGALRIPVNVRYFADAPF